MSNISFFANVKQTKPEKTITILDFLKSIKNGIYKNEVQQARDHTTDKEIYKQIKALLPCVTISGIFSQRYDKDIIDHSGFICIDFDHVPSIKDTFKSLQTDPYTFGLFTSLSGAGIACIVNIKDTERHRDYFKTLSQYYRSKYFLEADPKCINESRLRIVSYDPNTYINPDAKIYTVLSGLKKAEKPIPFSPIIATSSDMSALINQIRLANIDITDGYENWLTIGFALADHLDQGGRDYFHTISAVNLDYDQKKTDSQYTHCLRSAPGRRITIGSFFYLCKIHGLEVSSTLTREAVNIVNFKRAQAISKDDAVQAIDHLEIDSVDRQYIVDQVYSGPLKREFSENLPLIERLELYLVNNYDIKRNTLGAFIEVAGIAMKAEFANQLWHQAQKFIDEKITQAQVKSIFDSEKIIEYNPIASFFEAHQSINDKGLINKLADCIPSDTWMNKTPPTAYKREFIKRWMVGMVAGALGGTPNVFILALVGKRQGTGKTEFFRRLLPDGLQRFYDESGLDHVNERDFVIKLAKNILIMDDEGVSKNYKESQKLKSLTSKKASKIRKLFHNEETDFKRIASLAMTSNETDILKDLTGNRRIIPINVTERIDHNTYNSINKTALIMEAYHLYKIGFEYELSQDEIDSFSSAFDDFVHEDIQVTAIQDILERGDSFVPSWKVYNHICGKMYGGDKIPHVFFGKKMSAAGIEKSRISQQNQRIYGYNLSDVCAREINGINANKYVQKPVENGAEKVDPELPF